MPRVGTLACLEVKMTCLRATHRQVGKHSAGKLHAGFDGGGLDDCLWTTLNGHEAGNGGYSHLSAVPGTGRRADLRAVEPVLYSTLSFPAGSIRCSHNGIMLIYLCEWGEEPESLDKWWQTGKNRRSRWKYQDRIMLVSILNS